MSADTKRNDREGDCADSPILDGDFVMTELVPTPTTFTSSCKPDAPFISAVPPWRESVYMHGSPVQWPRIMVKMMENEKQIKRFQRPSETPRIHLKFFRRHLSSVRAELCKFSSSKQLMTVMYDAMLGAQLAFTLNTLIYSQA